MKTSRPKNLKHLTPDSAAADNCEAWQEAVKGIKKMPEVEEKPSAPLIIGEISPRIDYAAVHYGAGLERLETGSIDNIDHHTAEKFKRGRLPIEQRLDLHGMTEKQAFSSVYDFIRNAYMQKKRCVLIVTGKGKNLETDKWYEKKGILKEAVPDWLNSTDLRPLILSFSYAQPKDGGEGALYVLLRRQRNLQEPTHG